MTSHRHFIVYKPFGYLSQFVDNSRKQKYLLGDLYDFPEGTMAIGRLDKNSEGLLLLTTDGKMSEKIRSKKVEKEYFVLLDGDIDETAIKEMERGVKIGLEGDKYLTNPCKTFKLTSPPLLPDRPKKIRDSRHGPTSWASVTITEGKFKQIRKMTAAVGYPTLRLVRVRVGNMLLGSMKPGEVKEVESFD